MHDISTQESARLPGGLIDVKALSQALECVPQTIFKMVRNGLFPKQIRFGRRFSRWLKTEVNTVINARIAGVSDEQIRLLVSKLHAERPRVATPCSISASSHCEAAA